MSAGTDVEVGDLQGLLVRGYGTLPEAAFVLLTVTDAAAARGTLSRWTPYVTDGASKPADTALNVALTARGIEVLAPDLAKRADFVEQFRSGMVTPYRSRLLGDVDEDDPGHWEWGGPGTADVHLLLLVYADTDSRLAARLDQLLADAAGCSVAATLRTASLVPNENFGFHDGISQPRVEGLGATGDVKPGEFVLGYDNEYGQRVDDDLLRNGTYLVLRTLRQDVEAFHAFTEEATRDASGRPDPAARELLAAKMVGRWPSGAPLVLAPAADDASLADANDFGYQSADPRGIACPIGSHVRRTNPRDTLDPRPGTDASLAINRRHRLLRRGRAYGDPAASGTERGVHFIALSANLARQYEFVQHTWVNNPAFNGLAEETDPVIGVRRAKNSSFTTPDRPVRRRYADLPQFVHVRGGAYFFLPGLATLRAIAGPTR